jgi:hypothetical protein
MRTITSREEDKAETWKALNELPVQAPIEGAFHYCPYIPLQIVGALPSSTPPIKFKTRYGITQ